MVGEIVRVPSLFDTEATFELDVLHVGQVIFPVAVVIARGLDAVTTGVPDEVPAVQRGVPATAWGFMVSAPDVLPSRTRLPIVPLFAPRVALLVPVRVVNAPVPGVVPPIAPGEANVAPPRDEAFRFATFVVLVTVKGAVPTATVETSVGAVIAPLADIVPVMASPVEAHCAILDPLMATSTSPAPAV